MVRTCAACGKSIAHKSPRAKYCDEGCRDDYRKKGVRPQVTDLSSGGTRAGDVYNSTRDALIAAGRLDTPKGRVVLELAMDVDNPSDRSTEAGRAALTRQLCVILDQALDGAARAGDELDELERKRHERARRAGVG